jgi:hypothetical protein
VVTVGAGPLGTAVEVVLGALDADDEHPASNDATNARGMAVATSEGLARMGRPSLAGAVRHDMCVEYVGAEGAVAYAVIDRSRPDAAVGWRPKLPPHSVVNREIQASRRDTTTAAKAKVTAA